MMTFRCWSCSPIAYLHAEVESPDLDDILRGFAGSLMFQARLIPLQCILRVRILRHLELSS